MTVKAKQKNVWLVCGDDAALVQAKKQELIRRYFKGNPPDPTVFDGTGSFAEYRSALEGQSLFSSDTAVVIQNPFFLKRALKKDDEKPCAAFFAGLRELAPDIFLVMTLDGKPDKRTKAVKGLLDFASLIECDYLKAEDGAQHMEEYLYDRGKRLLPDARAYLEDVLSQWSEISAPFLETECDKIILVCGDEANVTKALLEDSLTDYMDQGIFSFFDRLLARDAKAVREAAPRAFTDQAAILKNVGFLAAQFRRIKMLKEMDRARTRPAEKSALLGMRSAWQMKRLAAQARQVTEKEAEDFLLALFEWQYEQRLGVGSGELEDVLLRFCLHRRTGVMQ